MTDQDLAQLSNTAIYSAMVVLTLAMLAYAVYLARLAPTRGEQAGTDTVESRDGARELVGADGRAVTGVRDRDLVGGPAVRHQG